MSFWLFCEEKTLKYVIFLPKRKHTLCAIQAPLLHSLQPTRAYAPLYRAERTHSWVEFTTVDTAFPQALPAPGSHSLASTVRGEDAVLQGTGVGYSPCTWAGKLSPRRAFTTEKAAQSQDLGGFLINWGGCLGGVRSFWKFRGFPAAVVQ